MQGRGKEGRGEGRGTQYLKAGERQGDTVLIFAELNNVSRRVPEESEESEESSKFGSLYAKVKSLGADYLATGHYGRIEYNEGTDQFELKKAKQRQGEKAGGQKGRGTQYLFPWS